LLHRSHVNFIDLTDFNTCVPEIYEIYGRGKDLALEKPARSAQVVEPLAKEALTRSDFLEEPAQPAGIGDRR
jgi:hypothetical protein